MNRKSHFMFNGILITIKIRNKRYASMYVYKIDHTLNMSIIWFISMKL